MNVVPPLIRLLALDLDGTLLDSSGGVSAANRAAIGAARALGAGVVVVTGRAAADIDAPLLAQLNLELPVICSHGAQSIDPKSGATIDHVPLADDRARALLEYADRNALSAAAYVSGRYWCLEGTPSLMEHVRGPRWRPVRSLLGIPQYETPTFLRLFGRTSIDAICTAFGTWPLHFKHESWETFDECAITSPDATKELALARLCAELAIPAEAVLAIGDSRNDVPMLRWAGVGVAMANAPSDVRARVARVTAACDDDGVARAIERYVLAPAGETERSA